MENQNAKAAEVEIADIMNNADNPRHEKFLKSDRETQEYVSGLWARTAPLESESSRICPQGHTVTDNNLTKSGAAPLTSEANVHDVCIEELGARWPEKVDANLDVAGEELNFIFQSGDADDDLIFNRVTANGMGNNADFLALAFKAGQDRASIGQPAPQAGVQPLSLEEEQNLVRQAAAHYFGTLQGNSLFEHFVEAVGTDDAAFSWAVQLGRRLFGK